MTPPNKTTYNYDGSCNSLFSTSTTFPTVNGVTLSTSQTWDCNGGVKTSSTDANGNVTTYKYVNPTSGVADPLWRLLQVINPDTGGTTTTYNTGATLPWSVSTSTAITGSINLNKTTIYDGLARVIQTQLTSDTPSTTYTQTVYDVLGRKSQVYNPTRCNPPTTNCGETTWGYATYTYDALDRVLSVLQPDNSTVSTVYSGNCTTVTDEVGNARKSCVDGLGRLTGVWEDPSGLNYETDYAYDALSNLLSVNQKGGSGNSANWRTRTFTYDGLSRLLCAANPEIQAVTCPTSNTGTFPALATLYTYDANGNVSTKTAPSPNQPSTGTAIVTTNNGYDALNRLTGKTFTDGYSGNPPTPGVKFGYDGAALTGCTPAPPALTDPYPKGFRTAMCDGSGAASWKHDQMGRILQERRTIGSAAGDYETDAYNLDGSPSSLTTLGYGVTYTYSGAARALTATNYTGGTNKLVSAATYAPPGELATMTNGSTSSFTGIVTNNAYNNRLQPILLSAGVSGQNPVFSECFDFHLSVQVTGPSPCSFSASALGDSGNVYQIVNNRDSNRTESFNYDSLNRIYSGQSSGTQWGETFTIDPWGNMTNEGGITGKTYHESLNTSAGTNNQLAGFTYDAAGNMTSNGSTSYVYDAENRLVWTNGTPASRYIYDGDGQRVEKCAAASPTTACPTSGSAGTLYWRGVGSDPLTETDLSGNVQNTYVFFNGQRVARRDSAGAIHYYFSDHLGSHGVVENATGTTC